MVRVCFVCLGNICRSPTAEGIMLHLIERAGLREHISAESAGTADYHVGEPPDPRSVAAARARGVELPSLARRFERQDFARFDYVLAADTDNLRRLHALAPDPAARAKVQLLRSFDPDSPHGAAVPDPYYGEGDGFERVFEICVAACRGLLEHIRRERRL
jgi:protein-tyrosine phosphatase